MSGRERRHDRAGVVSGTAVNDKYFEATHGVILKKEAIDRVGDELGFVADRHNDRDP